MRYPSFYLFFFFSSSIEFKTAWEVFSKELQSFQWKNDSIPVRRILIFLEVDNAFFQLLIIKGDVDQAEQACLDPGSELLKEPSSQAWGNFYP